MGTVEGGSCHTRDDQALLQFARGHQNLGVDSVDGRFRSDFMGFPLGLKRSGFSCDFLTLHDYLSQTKWIFQKGHSQNEAIKYHSGLENDSWIRFWLFFFPESDFATTFRGFFLGQAIVAVAV